MFDFIQPTEYSSACLMVMLFLHIIGDFILQTDFMAKYKQRDSWKEYIEQGKYKSDYMIVLWVHAFSWACVTFLPLLFLMQSFSIYFRCVLINAFIHEVIDDLKCNSHRINLWIDQGLHIVQIIATLLIVNGFN